MIIWTTQTCKHNHGLATSKCSLFTESKKKKLNRLSDAQLLLENLYVRLTITIGQTQGTHYIILSL